LAYFRLQFKPDPEVDLDDVGSDELADFATDLLNTDPSHGFIFKGMENVWEKVSHHSRIDDVRTYMIMTDSKSELGHSVTPLL
jgi:hypothetical protein